MTTHTLDDLLSTATKAALQAGEMLQNRWSQPRRISEKGFRDLVTDADHASQALITETIQSHFPDHGFLVEEEDSTLPTSGPIIWVIDPIDGTTNYSRQIPVCSISIAAITGPLSCVAEPDILAGVIYDPIQKELFQAAAGEGAFLNDDKIAVSETADLAASVIAVDWSHAPAKRQTTLDMLQAVAHQVQTLRAVGSAALALAWVACGRLDGYFNLNLKPWDVAAGKLLISEAGGHVETLTGQPWNTPDVACVAGNGRLTTELRMRLQIA